VPRYTGLGCEWGGKTLVPLKTSLQGPRGLLKQGPTNPNPNPNIIG